MFKSLSARSHEAVVTAKLNFDQLPTPVKIIVYSGLSLLVAQLVSDVETLDSAIKPYITILLGMVTNLIAWKVMQIKEGQG